MELGRVDICVEVLMMSSHLALTRRGHFEQVLHIFGYIEKHYNAEMVFDPSEPSISQKDFKYVDWYLGIYGDIKE